MLTITDLHNEQELSSFEMGKVAGGDGCTASYNAANALYTMGNAFFAMGCKEAGDTCLKGSVAITDHGCIP